MQVECPRQDGDPPNKMKHALENCTMYYRYIKFIITAHGCDCQLISITAQRIALSAVPGQVVGGQGSAFAVGGQDTRRQRPALTAAVEPIPVSILERIADVGLESGVINSTGPGLFPKDFPVPLSLEEAVAGVATLVGQTDQVNEALRKAQETEAVHPHIPEHMRAALALYAQDAVPREESFHFRLNRALRSICTSATDNNDTYADTAANTNNNTNTNDSITDADSTDTTTLADADTDALSPWRNYLWLLLHALKHLEPVPELRLYRGCKADRNTATDTSKGTVIHLQGVLLP